MDMEVTKTVEDILNFIGTEKNILSVKRCKTRLRLNLKNKKIVDVGKFKRVDGVLGIVETKDQFQIILEPQKANGLIQEFNKALERK